MTFRKRNKRHYSQVNVSPFPLDSVHSSRVNPQWGITPQKSRFLSPFTIKCRIISFVFFFLVNMWSTDTRTGIQKACTACMMANVPVCVPLGLSTHPLFENSEDVSQISAKHPFVNWQLCMENFQVLDSEWPLKGFMSGVYKHVRELSSSSKRSTESLRSAY